MKADDKLQILKFFLMLINSFFVILGISIFACSAWILFDKDSFVSVLSSVKPNVWSLRTGSEGGGWGLFFIGLVVVFVSFLGCAGTYFESRCFIIFYMCFLIVIILGQLFITFVLLIQIEKIKQFLKDNVDEIIKEYGGNETQTSWKLLDSVQTSAKCCGRVNSSDWRNNTFIDIYPCSCFNGTCPAILDGTHSFGNGSDIYKTGCEKFLVDWLEVNIIVIFGMDVGLLLIQILQFIFGIQTFKCIGRKTRELHPNNLLQAMEENPAAQPEHQQYSMENQKFNTQTYNPQMDNGYYHHGGYVDGNYDQFKSPEFYEPDNSQMYNSHPNLQYQQSYNGGYGQGYMQHQKNHPDDY